MRALLIGSAKSLVAKQALIAEATAAGHKVETCELDPSKLCKGCIGRFVSGMKLRKLTSKLPNGLIVLVEDPGDTAWEPWMVYAAGAGIKMIAVPNRLKGIDNIACVRSGVAVYEKLATLADLEDAAYAAMWESQKLASIVG